MERKSLGTSSLPFLFNRLGHSCGSLPAALLLFCSVISLIYLPNVCLFESSDQCWIANLHRCSKGQQIFIILGFLYYSLSRIKKTSEDSGNNERSGVSDYVVSHGSKFLETHGWVQLGAITEAMCVWLTMKSTWRWSLIPFLPSPPPADVVGGALPLLLLHGSYTITSVNDLKLCLLIS